MTSTPLHAGPASVAGLLAAATPPVATCTFTPIIFPQTRNLTLRGFKAAGPLVGVWLDADDKNLGFLFDHGTIAGSGLSRGGLSAQAFLASPQQP